MFLTLPRERTRFAPAAVPFHLLSAGENVLSWSHQVTLYPLPHGKTVRSLSKHANNGLIFPVGKAFPQRPFALFGRDTREEKSKLGRFRW